MRPRILLAVGTYRGYGRQVVAGVTDYVHRHGQWDVVLDRAVDRIHPETLDMMQPVAGAITLAPRLDEYEPLCGIPMVSVENSPLPIHQVIPDDRLIGKMAAEHLLSLGLKTIAYAGMLGIPFSDARRDAMAETAREQGAQLLVYPEACNAVTVYTDDYASWLEALPLPCGLLLVSSARATGTLIQCERLGIRVPEDLAVLGVEEDPMLCQLTNPPLSAIDHNTERVGYEAAALLDRLLAGEQIPPEVTWIPPRGVVTRQSTEMLATQDEGVVRAVRYIREHVEESLTVKQLLRHVPVGRRTLEQAFKRHLGRTIADEIRRQKIAQARQLLVQTTLGMADVAVRAGFSSASHMTHVFKRELGVGPAEFRSEHGLK
jgi:LacI family transcriptional regulator